MHSGKSFPKPDLKAFATALSIYPKDVLYQAFVEYGLSPTLKLVRRWHKLPQWLKLFRELLKERFFILVVLDDCRYDLFSHVYGKYFRGELTAARSMGAHTYGWLPEAFSYPEFRNIRIFYAGTAIKTHDIKLDEFVPPFRNIEVFKVKPREENNIGVALPWEVNEAVLKSGLRERNIIWYMQPHYPWIRHRELSLKLLHEVTWHDFTPKDLVREKLKREGISRHEVVKAYLENLKIALNGASSLIKELKDSFNGKIVVTSDHGELLGEYGLYLHPHYELPQLCIVPWLEVKDVA